LKLLGICRDVSPEPTGTGCNVADLCAPGWHVCLDANDVTTSSPNGCVGVTRPNDPALLFLTRQSSTGCGVGCIDVMAVLNISGTTATLRGGHTFSGGIDQHGVLFNFVNATAISSSGYGLWGTMLAPHAHIAFSNGSFDGGIYARSIKDVT
jgi:hypothetical protein